MATTTTETPTAAASPTAKPEKRKKGRPKEADRPFVPTARTFFDRLAAIHRDDWGTRAYIHLYRLEPFTDRLRSGNVVYIMKYLEPIDETRILMDHGSGRYRALLNFRKPSEDKDGELDRAEFELINLKFPPKVPKGEWVDDPRNKKWEWARNFFNEDGHAQQQQPAANGFLDIMKAQNEALRLQSDIRKDTLTEFQALHPAAPPPDVIAQLKAAREILQPPTDNTLLTTIVTLMTKQVEASATEAKELRAEIRQSRDASNGGFSVDKIVAGAEKLMPLVERIWPAAKEGVAKLRPVRSNMSGWQEFLQPIVPSLLQWPGWNPLLHGVFAAKAQVPPNGNGAPPHISPISINGAPPIGAPNGQHGPNTIIGFLQEISRPMLNHLLVDADGGELGDQFGAFLYDGWSGDPRYEQVLSTARMMGSQQIIGVFQQNPALWQHIAPVQAKFTAFMDAFLKWTPAESEDGIQEAEVIETEDENARRSM